MCLLVYFLPKVYTKCTFYPILALRRAKVQCVYSSPRSGTVWVVPCTVRALQPSRTEWFVHSAVLPCEHSREPAASPPRAVRALSGSRHTQCAPCTVHGQHFFSHSGSRAAILAQFVHSAVRARSVPCTSLFLYSPARTLGSLPAVCDATTWFVHSAAFAICSPRVARI